ncbi:hypothetical protein PVOR_15279 [Paenibacillus vortex V453]|uniref:Uncharacterized protein n=1 Tax=Paenibacillus vortex V453 TaxID=715225 RepID=A0A2R9SUI0_9BACL|nr:hypothetical protein PVOR_15279 [Paenibacillus vortex V453]
MPETWLSLTGTLAQYAPEYSAKTDFIWEIMKKANKWSQKSGWNPIKTNL